MANANWRFRQVFGEKDSTEEPADGAPQPLIAIISLLVGLSGCQRALGVMPEHWQGGGLHRAARACHDAPPRTPRAEDLISAVEFDAKGEYLATGDRGGRVVIFESSDVASGGAAPVRAPRCRRPSRMGCRGSCRGEGADALPSACRVPRRVVPL